MIVKVLIGKDGFVASTGQRVLYKNTWERIARLCGARVIGVSLDGKSKSFDTYPHIKAALPKTEAQGISLFVNNKGAVTVYAKSCFIIAASNITSLTVTIAEGMSTVTLNRIDSKPTIVEFT